MKKLKILTATMYHYYGNPDGIEPQFYYLYKVPKSMGHEVDFFDYRIAAEIGHDQMQRLFLNTLRGGKYDAAFIATYQDDFDKDTLKQAKKLTNTFGWNSDDEWRWENYSSDHVNDYTFMVSNDPDVYANNHNKHQNLLHAQWACTGFWNGLQTRKDIDFSFVGQVYGKRKEQIDLLAKKAGLKSFGFGSGNNPSELESSGLKSNLKLRAKKTVARKIPRLITDVISFEKINELWNRSKVSFTPLDSSQGDVRQIKSRIFDMGLSGTLMLSHKAPRLDEYYEPGKEYVPFESLEECLEKAKFYLTHEPERKKIAEAYAARTKSDHLWEHRIMNVLKDASLI